MRKTYLGIILLTLLTLCSCNYSASGAGIAAIASESMPGGPAFPIPPVQEPPQEETFVISAVGDIMMHNTQLEAGAQPGGIYDYASFFRYVKPLLSVADITIGNLETTFAGKEAGYSGYPAFNSPAVLAENLQDAGFDVLTTANNHCLDKGTAGLINTLDTLDAAGLSHTGTFRSAEEREQLLIIEKKGIKTAVLAYTYGVNGPGPAANKSYLVNYMQAEKMIADIKKARSAGVQVVVISLHFGQEYQNEPNAEQRRIVQILFNEGADIILGHHPHVLQPAYVYHYEEAGGFKDKAVVYSLGNFISDQAGLERTTSVILNIHIQINQLESNASLQKVTYTPLKTRRYRQGGRLCFEVLPIKAALFSASRETFYLSRQEKQGLEDAYLHASSQLSSDDPRLLAQPLEMPLDYLDKITSW